MKTQRMKSKDRHLGVLNMPEATEVVLHRKSLKNSGYYISTILVSLSGGRGEEVEAEQEKEEIANHLSQDHCKQDLFHHQPSDEGRIQNWRKLSVGSFFLSSGGKPFESSGDPGKARKHDACWRLSFHPGSISVERDEMKIPGCQRRWGS